MDYEKLNNRIDHMINYETDDFLVSINLEDKIGNKLFCYQHLHVFNLITALRNNNVVLDGSDTGTGKTYTSAAICRQLKLKPFIICPKASMTTWERVCKYFEVQPLCIVNYETVKNGKCYNDGNRIDCPYIKIQKVGKITSYVWKLPKYSIIIFDEVHKCRNIKTQNALLLMSAKNEQNVLMLSATLADRPSSFHIFGHMLGFYKSFKGGKNWINGMIKEDKSYIGVSQKLSAINRQIFPNKGSRMRIAELGDQFPKNQVSADCYYIDKEVKEIVNKSLEIIKGDKKIRGDLQDILKARMKLEEIKIPIIKELINDNLENGYSIVVFVNFNKTLRKLAKIFNTTCIVNGETKDKDREQNIQNFQDNKERLILCNIEAGGTSLSLHDLHGIPRISIISPPLSSITLMQALGRINRSGAKSPALQRLIYCEGTCEEIICNKVKSKLDFLAKLNDNDLVDIE